MSFYELADPVVKARAKAAWLNEAELVHDSRRRWARGWQRVKQVLCEVRKEKDRVRREESGLAAEIAWRRDMITEDSSAEEVQALARMEGRLKAQELRDAREWKMRSREKWIGEDAAPARYFFTRLKLKWAREAIVALEDKDGEFLTDREEIFGEIHQIFQVLYTAEDETSERMQEREEVIGMMNKRLSENDSEQLSLIPDAQEVEKVVFGMAHYKSPGYDGLTTDVVCECWDFVGSACVQLVQTIWAKKRVLRADCHGIIKLIPKPGEKRFLSNWRPISLMNWTYKLISKPTTALTIYFLWEVLKKARLNQHFLQLVQGFTCGGQARVHVNRGFTPDIQIARRVRQGCTHAPLLFALCTEPFMRMMEEPETAGRNSRLDARKYLLGSACRAAMSLVRKEPLSTSEFVWVFLLEGMTLFMKRSDG
ncbi:hypothetical protein R1sor_025722 [Riccia sorocarpa]|uniref:Reverse transcriptase n=1 Tax=Riccia sorocarpa TaxID=122646 RepID=A0ABD3GDB8_9MARC